MEVICSQQLNLVDVYNSYMAYCDAHNYCGTMQPQEILYSSPHDLRRITKSSQHTYIFILSLSGHTHPPSYITLFVCAFVL